MPSYNTLLSWARFAHLLLHLLWKLQITSWCAEYEDILHRLIILIHSFFFSLFFFGDLVLRKEFLIYGHSKLKHYFGVLLMLITSCFSKFFLSFPCPAYQNVQSFLCFPQFCYLQILFSSASSAADLSCSVNQPLASFTLRGQNIPSSLSCGSLERCLFLS